MTEAGAVRMLSFLRDRFDEVKVVAFVRPPHSLVHSLAQEQIQNMGHGIEWLRSGKLFLPYKRDLQKWRALVGSDLTVKVFSRSTLLKGCAVATMLDFAGVAGQCYEDMNVIQSNPTLSMFATELFCVANDIYPPRIENGTESRARKAPLHSHSPSRGCGLRLLPDAGRLRRSFTGGVPR